MIDISDITTANATHKIFLSKNMNKISKNLLKQPKADITYLLILAPVVGYRRSHW